VVVHMIGGSMTLTWYVDRENNMCTIKVTWYVDGEVDRFMVVMMWTNQKVTSSTFRLANIG